MLNYFDLNKRGRSLEQLGVELGPQAPHSQPRMNAGSQICLYLGLFVGVLFSSVIDHYKTANAVVNPDFSVGVCLVSAVIALMLVPIVYEKLNVDPRSPYIVQMGFFVQNGVFWHVLMTAAGKSVLPNQ